MDDLELGIKAYKEGKRDEARNIFISVLKGNPDNERAWAWMSNVVDSDKDRIYCLKQALRINPNNQKVKQILDELIASPPISNQQVSPSVPPPTISQTEDQNGPTTSNIRNSSPPIATRKHQKSLNKKTSYSLWIVGTIVLTGVIGLVCLFALGILFRNFQPSKQLAPNPTSTPAIGKWRVSTSKSEFDDSTTVVLLLDAEDYVQGWLDTTLPTLILRCKESKLDVYVKLEMQSNVEYGLYDAATVRIRFDQNQPVELIANESTDGDSLFFRNPSEMIKAMLQSKEMVFGFTPFNANPVSTTFDLRGLENAIAPLQKSCR